MSSLKDVMLSEAQEGYENTLNRIISDIEQEIRNRMTLGYDYYTPVMSSTSSAIRQDVVEYFKVNGFEVISNDIKISWNNNR